MGLFGSIGRNHLHGYKELTKHSDIIHLLSKENDKVYFPSMAPNRSPINFEVKEGDHVLVGQRIGSRTDFYVPIYSSVSGTVLPTEKVFSSQIGMSIPHLVIASDGKYELAKPLKTVSLESSVDEIFEAVKESGMVGMGGAGFPTYIKYAGKNDGKIDTLIVNAVECEPYLTTDFVTTILEAPMIVSGIELLMKLSGAQRCLIGIKVHKEEARDALINAIGGNPSIHVVELKDLYPVGWEKVLIQELTKRTYERLPSEAGCIVNNVQTVRALGQVLLQGRPITKRIVTVSGDGVVNPTNIEIDIGRIANELINAAGGYNAEEITLIPGGPMCSKAITNDNFPMLTQMGALTVLKYKKVDNQVCLRCGQCVENCPAHLQPVEIKNAFEAKDVGRMLKLEVLSCVECGTCSYVCPSHCEVSDYVKKSKALARMRKK